MEVGLVDKPNAREKDLRLLRRASVGRQIVHLLARQEMAIDASLLGLFPFAPLFTDLSSAPNCPEGKAHRKPTEIDFC